MFLSANRPIVGLLLLSCVTVTFGQQKTPAQDFAQIARLYYTPTEKGLKSFHCNVSFDWPALLDQAAGKPVPRDLPALKYLETVSLSIDDDLKTKGRLNWESSSEPPTEASASIQQIRQGLVQTWQGFFQTWNPFMNGYMTSVTDDKTKVERTDKGFHLIAQDEQNLAEEQYDKDLLLEMHVRVPSMEVSMQPHYVDSPQGRIVESIRTRVGKTLAAPSIETTMTVKYADASGYKLPSSVNVDVINVASFVFRVANCTINENAPPSQQP